MVLSRQCETCEANIIGVCQYCILASSKQQFIRDYSAVSKTRLSNSPGSNGQTNLNVMPMVTTVLAVIIGFISLILFEING